MTDMPTVTMPDQLVGEPYLNELLEASAARHSHLCPRQVLGVRAGLAGLASLRLELPVRKKRLLVIAETDGCFTDGVEVATGSTPGHRTLRIEDYGKTAATFIDTLSGEAIRIAPRLDARARSWDYAPGEKRHYFAQLTGYQVMPVEELFSIQPVCLTTSLEAIISRAGVRTTCDRCGEDIINEREVVREGETLCRACGGPAYYILRGDQKCQS